MNHAAPPVLLALAAIDQVTISYEAEGTVRAILADRVEAGQVPIQLDNEKQPYTCQPHQAALARTLSQYGPPDP